MIRYFRFLFVIGSLFFLFQIAVPPAFTGEKSMLTIDDVLKNVDPAKVTKAQVKEYYKEIEGQKVKGEGTVVNFFPGARNTHRIALLTAGSDPEKGYNVMLYVTQDSPPDVSKGDRITFQGEITRLSAYKGALIDIHGTSFQKTGTKQ